MLCKHCESDKLALIAWHDVNGDHWDVYVRCGDCRVGYWKLLSQEEAEAWEEIYDEQMEAMREAARDLEVTDVLTTEAFHE